MSASWSTYQLTVAEDLWKQGFKAGWIAQKLGDSISPYEVAHRAKLCGWKRAEPKVGRRHPCCDCGKPNSALRKDTRCSDCAPIHEAEKARETWRRIAAKRRTERAEKRRAAREEIAAELASAPVTDPAQTELPIDVVYGPHPLDLDAIDPAALCRAERMAREARIGKAIDAERPRLDAVAAAELEHRYRKGGSIIRRDGTKRSARAAA